MIVVALGIAGLTFFLAKGFLDEQTEEAQGSSTPAIAAVQVVVAVKDLPAGTIIQEADTRWQPWPEQTLDPTFIVQAKGEGAAKINDLNGNVVRRAITAGEPVTFVKVFKRGESGFLSGAMTPGMRAVSINVKANTGAAGFILPGDRVDIILVQNGLTPIDPDDDGPGITRASETILRDIRVLAADQLVDDIQETAQLSKTVTLEVTPKQAEVLAVAGEMGKLTLALRSLTPGTDDPSIGNYTADLDVSLALGGGLDGNDPKRRGAGGAVIVYRITNLEKIKVNR